MTAAAAMSIKEPIASFMVRGNGGKVKDRGQWMEVLSETYVTVLAAV